jgi:hypothetical protein
VRKPLPSVDDRAVLAAIADGVATTVNDHAPKAAFSLLRLYDHTGDPVFLLAAQAFVDRYGDR